MTRMGRLAAAAGALGAAAGLAAAGAAVGLAAERYVVGRSLRGADPYADEAFGSLRGRPVTVLADDGVELYAEIDEPHGQRLPFTVVFSHGYALNLDSWHFQRRDLRGPRPGRPAARAVFWDQRSHGRSGRSPAEGVSLEQLGRDLARVIDELVPAGPVVLVGHSMGGMTVMSLAGQRPELFGERVVGVGLVATSPGGLSGATLGLPGPAGRLFHRYAPGAAAVLARRPTVVEQSRRAGSDLGYVLTKRYAFGSDVPASIVELTADMNAATPIEVLATFLPVLQRHDAAAALAPLERVESCVVGAVADRLTPVEHSREIVRHLPGTEYVEVPDAGHMVMLERHELVSATLADLYVRCARALPPVAADRARR